MNGAKGEMLKTKIRGIKARVRVEDIDPLEGSCIGGLFRD
jgi:hypothetical protein